jgi:AraC-like DNA-binding protein
MQIKLDTLQPLLELLQQRGVSEQQLLASVATGTDTDSSPSRLQIGHILSLLETAVTLSDDPTLALRLGQNLDFSSLGVLGFAMQNCKNIQAVLDLVIRYHTLFKLGEIWELLYQNDQVVLQVKLQVGNPIQQQLITELLFSQLFVVTKYLTGKPTFSSELHLHYAKPDHYRKYRTYFPVKVKFDQPQSQIIIQNEILNAPIKTANPAGHIVFQQQCEEMLRDLNRIENTAAAVRRILIQGIGNFPSLGQAAKKLHISESTLRRRLDNESTSFRTLCDEVKNVLAEKYLMETELSVADIAHLLDYTATPNFRRAFVRWNKITPSEFRASN